MSFLGGLLSPGLTAATNTVSAYQGAQAKEGDKQKAEAIQQMQMQRQMREQVLKDALTQAQTTHALRQSAVLQLGDPTYNDAKAGEAGAVAAAQVAPHVDQAVKTAAGTSPITTQTAINTAAGVSPITTRTAVNTARGEAPIKTAQAVATKAGELPYAIKEAEAKRDNAPLNADENTASVHLPMMASALKAIRSLPNPSARTAMTAQGGFWRNYLNTPEGRQFTQAANQGALSGAVATEGPRGAQLDRVQAFKKTYVPSAGNDDATNEQALANYLLLAKSVKMKSGRGYNRMDPETRALIDGVLNGDQQGQTPPTESLNGAAKPFSMTIGGKTFTTGASPAPNP